MRLWLKLDDVKEYDVRYGAWMLYGALYQNNGFIPSGINFDKDVITNGNRRFVTKYVCHCGKKMKIDLSGETDFNFSNRRIFGIGKSRIQFLRYYLKDVPQKEKKLYSKLLTFCEKHFHSQVNISLLPKTGSLNLAKKAIGNDRIDTYIWALNEYYNEKACLLLNCCSNENMDTIKEYLGLFENVYDYCATIYFIDQDLVNDLIHSGTKPIDTYQRAMEYMMLATRFWKQKEKEINGLKYENSTVSVRK